MGRRGTNRALFLGLFRRLTGLDLAIFLISRRFYRPGEGEGRLWKTINWFQNTLPCDACQEAGTTAINTPVNVGVGLIAKQVRGFLTTCFNGKIILNREAARLGWRGQLFRHHYPKWLVNHRRH
jgi:hypothetical protein